MTEPAPATPPAVEESLLDLTARWRDAADREEAAKDEKAALRAQLEARGVTIGHADDYLVVTETSDVDLENAKLRATLKRERVWKDAHESKLSVTLIRALAIRNEAVARALAWATKPKARWERPNKQ